MDYLVGNVAALISGNVTPNRPKLSKRALTPTKHMPSPNVTPKSELVDDRSIFLSPSVQKKKAIVKKSPKRIFQNPDLDVTNENDGNAANSSPKADKVKKHLKGELDATVSPKNSSKVSKTLENTTSKPIESPSPKKKAVNGDLNDLKGNTDSSNEITPKKKKKRNSLTEASQSVTESIEFKQDTPKKSKKQKLEYSENVLNDTEVDNTNVDISKNANLSTKKKKNKNKTPIVETEEIKPQENVNNEHIELEASSPKKKNKKHKKQKSDAQENGSAPKMTKNTKVNPNAITNKDSDSEHGSDNEIESQVEENNKDVLKNVRNDTEVDNTILNVSDNVKPSKKKKKNKKKPHMVETEEIKPQDDINNKHIDSEASSPKKINKKRQKQNADSAPKKNKKIKVNPNAITDKDSDSEHDSDNDIESETEQNNKDVLAKSVEAEPSSDEEETPVPKKKKKEGTEETEKVKEVNTEEEIKRTLFVGNVPFSKKCKKEIKKIFSKYGQIESVRIRTVPVKDPSVTPKLAVIKQELHPERSTVNVYVKFSHPQCVDEALAENNTVLNNNHLRVTRSGSTGADHDPRHSVFVGNIPFALEDEGLREKFEKCGEIESVRIVRDKKTNAGKGFGYVNFTSRDGVELALALTDEDLTIKNRILRVKRCTQATHKQLKGPSNRPGFKGNKVSQGDRQRNQTSKPFNQGRKFDQGGKFQGNRGGNNFQGNRGGNRFQGNRGGNQGNRGGNFQGRGGNFGRQNDGEKQDGAYRRLAYKRKSQEGSDGPPSKMARDDAPREKKARKEFVGVTAEKKKKRKFDKGQKKKKALSEILTK